MSTSEQYNHSFYNETPWTSCTIHMDFNQRRIALFLLYLLIFVAGLLGNLLVLWVNWRRRHSLSGVLFCIFNISLSDTMMVLVVPFFMMESTIEYVWLWGKFLCIFTKLVYAVNFYSSSFFLALMTLERYLSLTRPNFTALFPAVGRRRWWLCAGVWIFSFFLALLENVHVDLLESDEPFCLMMPERDHLEWHISLVFIKLIFQFIGPVVVIITCNVLIFRAVRAAPDVQDKRDVWLVHVFSLVFVLCWLPIHLLYFIYTIDILFALNLSCNVFYVLFFFLEIFQVSSLFHCVANPILYNFLSKSFRSDLLNTMERYINKEGKAAQTRAEPNGGDASTSQSDMDA